MPENDSIEGIAKFILEGSQTLDGADPRVTDP